MKGVADRICNSLLSV